MHSKWQKKRERETETAGRPAKNPSGMLWFTAHGYDSTSRLNTFNGGKEMIHYLEQTMEKSV